MQVQYKPSWLHSNQRLGQFVDECCSSQQRQLAPQSLACLRRAFLGLSWVSKILDTQSWDFCIHTSFATCKQSIDKIRWGSLSAKKSDECNLSTSSERPYSFGRGWKANNIYNMIYTSVASKFQNLFRPLRMLRIVDSVCSPELFGYFQLIVRRRRGNDRRASC